MLIDLSHLCAKVVEALLLLIPFGPESLEGTRQLDNVLVVFLTLSSQLLNPGMDLVSLVALFRDLIPELEDLVVAGDSNLQTTDLRHQPLLFVLLEGRGLDLPLQRC